jgi:SPX domain protein involved in polyphosphate accumulation
MKSTYFDSAALDMVQHHLSKAESRFKIRTREYAPDGKLHKSDFTYLEVKAKHGNVSDKFRIKVPNGHMAAFTEGKPLLTDIKLAKANPHIGLADLVKRVDDLNNAMTTFMLRPSCEVSYARSAFSDGVVDGLRVTFDEGVRFNVLNDGNSGSLSKNDPDINNMVNGYSPQDHIILEVKHHGNVPDWLTQFLNKNNVAKTSFSKYCYSMGKYTKDKS